MKKDVNGAWYLPLIATILSVVLKFPQNIQTGCLVLTGLALLVDLAHELVHSTDFWKFMMELLRRKY